MAKEDEVKAQSDIFGKTEEAPKETLKKDLIKPTSFGLLQSERIELERIAKKNDLARNAMGRWAIQYFIKQYNAGKVKLQTETVKIEKVKAP
jgi:hypothetical protein